MSLDNMNVVEKPKKVKPNEGLITNSIRLKKESFEEVIKKVQKLMAERDAKIANLNKQITNDVIKGVSYDDIKENEKYKIAAAKIASLEKDIYILRMMPGPFEETNHRAIRLIKQMFDNAQYNSNEIYKGLDYSLNAKQTVKSFEDMTEENTSEPTMIEKPTTVDKTGTFSFDVREISKENKENVNSDINSAIDDNAVGVDEGVIGSDEITSVLNGSLEDVSNPSDINDNQEEVNKKLNDYINTLENESSTEKQAKLNDVYEEVSEEKILESRKNLGLPEYEKEERENAAKKFGKYDDNFRDTFGTEPVENIPYQIGLVKDENLREEPQVVPGRNSAENIITKKTVNATVEEYQDDEKTYGADNESKSLVLSAADVKKSVANKISLEELKRRLEADVKETEAKKAQLDAVKAEYEKEIKRNQATAEEQAAAKEENSRVKAEIEEATKSVIVKMEARCRALREERDSYAKDIDDANKNMSAISDDTAAKLADIDNINRETKDDMNQLNALYAMIEDLNAAELESVNGMGK